MKRFLALLTLAALLVPATAHSAFQGRILSATDKAPLADVQIRVEHRDASKMTMESDADGRFRIDIAELFGTQNVKPEDPLTLIFEKSGFSSAAKLVYAGRASQEVLVMLSPKSDRTILDAVEQEKLRKALGTGARGPLFLVPYELPVTAAGLAPETANERLRANLERVIVTYVQSTARINTGGVISLTLLPIDVGKEVGRLQTYGTQLNALAIITGYGNLEGERGQEQMLVSSTYVVVPQVSSLDSPIFYVDDALPAGQLASPRLWEHLSKLWGRSTVLALGMREFRDAQASNNRDKLRQIRTYLQAERASAGPGNEQLLVQLNALLALVDKELVK